MPAVIKMDVIQNLKVVITNLRLFKQSFEKCVIYIMCQSLQCQSFVTGRVFLLFLLLFFVFVPQETLQVLESQYHFLTTKKRLVRKQLLIAAIS